ncbi:MAG TPA: hypothetical protein VF462_07945 [Micromonosporaceae bacterium]
MSDPMNPAAPAARERPSSVTISSYLLMLVAALQVIGLIVALSVIGATREAYKQAFAGTNMADQAETIATASLIGGAVLGLLVAIALVVLAILNNRGKNASRIVTWVLGGLFVCCLGGALIVNAAGNAFGVNNADGANAPDQAEVQRVLNEHLPSWYRPVSTTISVIALLALLTALILLALPRSNEFFRKPQAAWEPPAPGSAYPGYPPAGGPGGAPGQQPGYQQPGYQQPGYQQPMPPPGGPGSQPPGGSQPPYPPSS